VTDQSRETTLLKPANKQTMETSGQSQTCARTPAIAAF